jgi:calcineurin-like phosphoesterase family protein
MEYLTMHLETDLDYDNLWLSSDHHFFHKNIITYCNRPFSRIKEMNQAMVDNHNSVVKPSDTVLFLGDFTFSTVENTQPIVSTLNGKLLILPGNHDSKGKLEKCGLSLLPRPYKIIYDNMEIWLDHYPYKQFEGVGKNIVDTGDWLLHGHVHEKWKINNKQINVGVDVWNFTPVKFTDIVALIKEKEGTN